MASRRSALLLLGLAACSSGAIAQATSGSGSSGSGGRAAAGGASSSSSRSESSSVVASSSSSASAGGAGGAGGAGTGGMMGVGGSDAGPLSVSIPAIPCTGAIADVYVPPTGLPPLTVATRGDVVACAFDSQLSLATVASEVLAKGIMTSMKTAVNVYRIEYRTTRGDGSDGASSARVYLPIDPTSFPLPIITVGHPTDGIAQSCAPSTDPTSNQDLALPWAGLGYVVIVSDYAGLGNGGVQSYLDNHDQAYSVLDAARALRKLLPAAALSSSVLAVGWSQGGGAVLSAQSLAKTYGSGGTLAGVITFAPEWPSRFNSFGYVDELENPTELTIQTGISEDVVTVMSTYAYFYNRVGAAHAGDGFPSSSSSAIDNAVNTLCQTPLGGYLQAADPHVGDIFDPTFRAEMLACIGGVDGGTGGSGSGTGGSGTGGGDGGTSDGGGSPGCTGAGLGYYNFLQQNFLTADPAGPPMLFVQGLLDYIMPPASEAACNLEKLAAEGVFPQVCVDPGAQHTDVVGRNMDFAIPWAEAILAGQAPATCSSAGLPTCTP